MNDHEHDGGRRAPGGDRDHERRGDGPDTRFLQLEMSQVLYGEAEEVARPAFRQLLLEASKEILRERLGDKIQALANLAIADLIDGMMSSLEIEARIAQRGEERSPSAKRVREIFAPAGAPSAARDARPRRAAASARKPKRR